MQSETHKTTCKFSSLQ